MEETDAYVQIYRFLEVTADWYDEKPVKERQRCDFRDIVIRRNELCLTVRLNQPAGSTIDCTRYDCTIHVPEICQTFSFESQYSLYSETYMFAVLRKVFRRF